NRRRPLLRMTEDTSPGVHDTLRAACDPVRYRMLGFEQHASCAENLTAALEDLGLKAPHSPCPLNMFENCPVGEAGALVVVPPPGQARGPRGLHADGEAGGGVSAARAE